MNIHVGRFSCRWALSGFLVPNLRRRTGFVISFFHMDTVGGAGSVRAAESVLFPVSASFPSSLMSVSAVSAPSLLSATVASCDEGSVFSSEFFFHRRFSNMFPHLTVLHLTQVRVQVRTGTGSRFGSTGSDASVNLFVRFLSQTGGRSHFCWFFFNSGSVTVRRNRFCAHSRLGRTTFFLKL